MVWKKAVTAVDLWVSLTVFRKVGMKEHSTVEYLAGMRACCWAGVLVEMKVLLLADGKVC